MKTTFSRRELYALGEPIGDGATHTKPGGHGRIYGMGGGGGTTQSTGTTYTTNIPEYAEPYVHTMLGATQEQLFDMNDQGEITNFRPYKPYSTDPSSYVAPFQKEQEQAFEGIRQLGPSQLGQIGGQLAGAATMGALGTGYDPYRMGQFNAGTAQQYMNPFLETAMEPQLREAQRSSEMQRQADQAQATRAGAFGGSRQAIVEAERQRNLGNQMGDIRARGYMSAFDQAQQNFAREQQMREQSRQYGAGLGMQGLQTALQGAGQMGQLGQTEFGQRQAALGMQQQVGAQRQSMEQQKINQAIQDYANAQQYPLMQLGVMSNMLRGLPMQAATTNQYVAAPNPITQGIGMAGAGASLYNAMRSPGGAAGGLPSEFKFAEGGIASVPRYDVGGEVYSDLTDMSVDQLRNVIKESSSQRVKEMAKGILAEKAAQRMYGGGIVAFQRGGDAVDPESEVSVPQMPFPVELGTPSFRRRAEYPFAIKPISDEENEKAEANYQFDQRMQAQDTANRRRAHDKLMEEIRTGKYDPNAEYRARMERDEANRASFIEDLRKEHGPAAVEFYQKNKYFSPSALAQAPAVQPAAPAAAARPAGVMAARPNSAAASRQLAENFANETSNLNLSGAPAAAAAPVTAKNAGITAAPAATAEDRAGEAEARAGVAPVTAEPTFTGPLADAQRAEYEARKRANRPVSAFLEDIETGKPENAAVAEYRKQTMAERANAKDEAERQRHMRLAQFFAKWGSTPGPTIAAGLNALEKTIPDLISDEKEQKKAKRELDKVSFDIDNSIRLEKLGDMKEARALKEKAADRAMNLQERLMQVQQNEEESKRRLKGTEYAADKGLETAKVRERGATSDRAESRKAREAREAEVRWQASRGQLETVESNIAREKTSKQYADAQRALQTAESAPGVRDAQGNIDTSKIPEGLRASYDKAKKLIEERDAEFDGRRRRAQNVVNRYAKEVGAEVDEPTRSREDTDALNWANANPKDPRAAEIKKRLNAR
jgi:hypothetical protein